MRHRSSLTEDGRYSPQLPFPRRSKDEDNINAYFIPGITHDSLLGLCALHYIATLRGMFKLPRLLLAGCIAGPSLAVLATFLNQPTSSICWILDVLDSYGSATLPEHVLTRRSTRVFQGRPVYTY